MQPREEPGLEPHAARVSFAVQFAIGHPPKEANMKTDLASLSVSRKRATRARSRVVFFLLRRGFRQLAREFRRYATTPGSALRQQVDECGVVPAAVAGGADAAVVLLDQRGAR
jgi:hypothetical protein